MTDCNCDTFPGNLTVLGNLGIGTASPQTGLNIVGSNASLRVGSTSQAGLDYNDGSGDLYVGGSNAQDGDVFVKDVNGNVQIALRAEGGGYLGVGTQNPQVGLHLAGVQSFRVGNTPQAGLDFTNESGDLYVGGVNAQDGDIFVNDLNGTIRVSIRAESGIQISRTDSESSNNELYFEDNGQIRSSDDNHRLIFDRANNILELREYGNIVFSPGATSGQRTGLMTFQADGSVLVAGRKVADASGCYYA